MNANIAMASLDLDFELLGCEQHIADLTLRINQLKETSPNSGSGFVTSADFIRLLQKTLESWQDRKRDAYAVPTCYWHQMRYSVSRSVNENNRHIVFVETGFDRLPDSIQRQGPWQHLTTGEFRNLRPEYQKALSERGYIIVEQSPHVFTFEKSWPYARPSHRDWTRSR